MFAIFDLIILNGTSNIVLNPLNSQFNICCTEQRSKTAGFNYKIIKMRCLGRIKVGNVLGGFQGNRFVSLLSFLWE